MGKKFLDYITGQQGDYKSGQEGLQVGAGLGISNRGKKITNRGRDFKLEQRNFKSGQKLKIGARGISKPLGFNFMNVINLHSENQQCKYFSTHSLL